MTRTSVDGMIAAAKFDRSPPALARIYLGAWRAGDFDSLRDILGDDVTFRGPLGSADGVEECLAGLRGMHSMLTGITIHKMLADDTDVMTWYDFEAHDDVVIPTVNWSHVENGVITAIRATFDPRSVAPPS